MDLSPSSGRELLEAWLEDCGEVQLAGPICKCSATVSLVSIQTAHVRSDGPREGAGCGLVPWSYWASMTRRARSSGRAMGIRKNSSVMMLRPATVRLRRSPRPRLLPALGPGVPGIFRVLVDRFFLDGSHREPRCISLSSHRCLHGDAVTHLVYFFKLT